MAFAAVVVAVTAMLALSACQPAPPAQRSAVILSDSILVGSDGSLAGVLRDKGWDVHFDAKVARPTDTIAELVRANRGRLTDTLVVSSGANDAGNTATFRARVDAVLDAAAGVPRIYWLTIREVRDYYPAANQVLRDAAASHPNLTIVDWNAASAGGGLTAADGLHLNGAGTKRISELIVAAVTDSPPPLPPPTLPPAAPQPPPPPETVVVPTTRPPLPPESVPPPTEPTPPAVPDTAPATADTAAAPPSVAIDPIATVPPTTAPEREQALSATSTDASSPTSAGALARAVSAAVLLAGLLVLALTRRELKTDQS